ncbi:alpha/beta fold hydrolase [Pseudophaeobacter arcticus]|jgi:flavin reductase (DIM6/NTAB) family NADH-FMN oxidoreductase RutF/pimeloyl-ACP methyl ester carboxylesterase|uniref:alpha/beta fold hydrolase n=3 Tax=Pseudophaeobacter arcticus TaxID=385492 RepID=UPI0039E36A6C
MISTTLPLSDPFGSLSYREAGSGEALVLIHGVGMQSAAWAPQIEALSQTHRVLSLDMPGHGGSSPLAEGADLPAYVAWLHAALNALNDALNLGPVNLAGHSMGALIAGGFACSHPKMLRRVALVNGVFRRSKQARSAVLARAAEIKAGKVDLETPLSRWFGDSPVEQQARAQVASWLSQVDKTGYATAYGAFARGDTTYAQNWSQIACPLLALTGDADPNSTPAMSRAMADLAQNGTVEILPGRHMVNLTDPDAVTDSLTRWLRRPTPTTKETPMAPAPFDPRALRDAFGTFMTGVTVVTSHDDTGAPLGFTANSFASVSLDPPLVLVCLANSARSYDALTQASGFAVNILAEDQKNISNTFARPSDDRFANVDWQVGPQGSPILAGVSAWFDCSMHKTVEAGDHVILIGQVEAFDTSTAPGLGYARGAYVTPAAEAEALAHGANLVVSALIERAGEVMLIDDGLGGLTLPQKPVGRAGASVALSELIASCGIEADPGFIYSVFEDAAREHQHISFLCQAGEGTPKQGCFTPLTPSTMMEVTDPALRIMLERFASESRMGNYGVFYGTQISGNVRKIVSGS